MRTSPRLRFCSPVDRAPARSALHRTCSTTCRGHSACALPSRVKVRARPRWIPSMLMTTLRIALARCTRCLAARRRGQRASIEVCDRRALGRFGAGRGARCLRSACGSSALQRGRHSNARGNADIPEQMELLERVCVSERAVENLEERQSSHEIVYEVFICC